MPISLFGQTLEFLRKSQNILVATPELISADSLGSALALVKTLNYLGKNAVLASSASAIPEKYQFFTGLELIKPKMNAGQETTISIATDKNKIRLLRYEKKDGQLFIILTPEEKPITKEYIEIHEHRPPEAIVTINCADSDDLGKLKTDNPKFFLETPLINIDHRPANLNYGTINLVDFAASSAAEIVWRLIKDLNPEIRDKDIATDLLAGIIESTRSFRSPATKPRSLLAASDLIELGANRELIVRSLYKTKPLAVLKLLGEMLEKIEFYPDQKFIFINLSNPPAAEDGAAVELTNAAMEELREIFPAADMIFNLWTKDKNQHYCFLSEREEELFNLARELNGKISRVFMVEGKIQNDSPEELKQKIFRVLGVVGKNN